jgi:hypothetical protein
MVQYAPPVGDIIEGTDSTSEPRETVGDKSCFVKSITPAAAVSMSFSTKADVLVTDFCSAVGKGEKETVD